MSDARAAVRVRPTTAADIPAIIELTRAVYRGSPPWTERQLASHLDVFPEGQLVAVDEGSGRLLGMAASLIVLWDDYDVTTSWRDFTDAGMFTNHDPVRGRTLYGAEAMVDPSAQRRGVGTRLYSARRALVERLGLLRIRAGARLRGYHRYAGELSAPAYVERVVRGELCDPTLSFQLQRGFHVLDVVSGYLHHDAESLGFAAVIEWINPSVATPQDYQHGDPRYRSAMPLSRHVVFSDLDGTLLDHDTYAFDAALPALERLRRGGVPLVLCTSKSRAEIEPLRVRLRNTDPFIGENGGAVFIPDGYFSPEIEGEIEGATRRDGLLVVPIGDAYADLVAALARASEASGVPVRGFAQMTDEEVASATGLPLDQARLARRREFDEPFEILAPARTGELLAAIEREGKRWTAGGRFHHIMGASDKAAAVRLLTALYRRQLGPVTTVGVGDAPNDASFLNEVDLPVLVASPRVDRLRTLVPAGRVTRLPGPAGWNEAVLAVLDARA